VQCLILLLALQQATPAISPDAHARLWAEFLSDNNRSVSREDKPFLRAFSFYNLGADPALPTLLKINNRFWVNNLHFQDEVEFPREVPGSNGLLWYFDLRDYGWNAAAWAAVAQREPYFIEPAVGSGPAQFIRGVIGATQNDKTFHVEGIVRADWFLRDTCELDRSTSYFDLLFAKQRFTEGKVELEDKVIDWPGGYSDYSKQVVPAGRYIMSVPKANKAKFVDFPKNTKDLEKLLGIDSVRKFIADSGINLQRGAVVEGGEKGVSIVARQNRLIFRTYGPIGWYYETFDAKETAGKRDYSQTLQKDFEHDAGETLFRLPAGGQGGFLSNAKGDSLTVADNRFATDSSDVRLDARVRNYGSCLVCHESGIIRPRNLVEEMMAAGVDIKFKDKAASRTARAFFVGWDNKLKNDQEEYAGFLKKTSGLAPAANSKSFKALRDAYDAPVDAAKAAVECGVSLDVWKAAASRSVKATLLRMVQGMSIARRTWEADAYSESVKLLTTGRKP
jgi:hypothetical protein